MKKKMFLIFATSLLFISCATTSNLTGLTKGNTYAKMYEEKPKVILIMPPINKTNKVEAKEYFYSSLAQPLCERGYYVISPVISLDFLKAESAYDSEQFISADLKMFNRFMGADALLFTTITEWSKTLLSGSITVGVKYEMRSTKTGDTLFERKGTITLDKSSNNNGLAGLIAAAVVTGLTDKIEAARSCNYFVLKDLPEGPYAPLFMQDQEFSAEGGVFNSSIR